MIGYTPFSHSAFLMIFNFFLDNMMAGIENKTAVSQCEK